MLVYGSVARGFKSGGWAAIFLRTDKNIRVDPEFVTSYEIGFKFTTPDNRFRLNAAAYVSKFTDYQIRQVLKFSQEEINVVLTNAGRVTSRGGRS